MLSVSATWNSTINFSTKTRLGSSVRSLSNALMSSASCSPSSNDENSGGGMVTLEEWQGWGTVSPLPAKVVQVIEDLKLLEQKNGSQMSFGGKGGKLQGEFKIVEDKKHRATYQSISDADQKLQFFSARQIACRLLGSRNYLCQKCWLPLKEDCTCQRVKSHALWHGIRLWLYMHPKDFLRQNNTGKLLWQVFGVESATLCLYGIAEHEDIMWNAFKLAGNGKVWCLYPNKNTVTMSVQDAFGQEFSDNQECLPTMENKDEILNFILIDGTWSNSAAMFRRLKEQAKSVLGVEYLPCISLSTGVSTMHKLRTFYCGPQPSWDRTCTAAAAIGLLSELQLLPEFSSYGLVEQAEALENNLVVLLDALTTRRLRMGRSIIRKVRQKAIC